MCHQVTWEAIQESIAIVQLWCYEGMDRGLASITCDITSDTTDITNMIITDFGYCIYQLLHHERCVKVYSQVLYWPCYTYSVLNYLKLDALHHPPTLVFWDENNQLCLFLVQLKHIIDMRQVLISARQGSDFLETSNQVSFGSIAI